jgi:molybdopterin molybdotransferase
MRAVAHEETAVGKGELISIAEARARVLSRTRPLPPETVSLRGEAGTRAALGRVLAEDVSSAEDLPPFDSSAMDGYAVAAAGGGELRVVDEARAGAPSAATLRAGSAIAISTGAQIPAGATAVVPVERVEVADGRVRVPAVERGANIRRAGEDVRAGDVVLRAGAALGPAEIAMLAQLGATEVRCGGVPRLSVLVTGDELVAPGEPLAPGQIRDSNGAALAALATAAGARVTATRRVGDDFGATVEALRAALEEADVVSVSGGVSVGEHDHVKPALAELGVEEVFWGVALKPGKPTWFGTAAKPRAASEPGASAAPAGARLVFGLPGNPVSAMVTFTLFARPALRALAGADPGVARLRARLDAPVRLNAKREQAVRCRLRAGDGGWRAEPTGPQGSHQISSMLGADGLALIPAGEGTLEAGETVLIEPLPRGTLQP